jgi:hypothetical protein
MSDLATQLQNAAVASGKHLVDNYRITGNYNSISLYKNDTLINSHASIGTAMLWLDRNGTPGDVVAIDVQYRIECR